MLKLHRLHLSEIQPLAFQKHDCTFFGLIKMSFTSLWLNMARRQKQKNVLLQKLTSKFVFDFWTKFSTTTFSVHPQIVTGFRESWFKERHYQPKHSRYILNFINEKKKRKFSQSLIKKINIWAEKFYQMVFELHSQILIGILWHLISPKHNTVWEEWNFEKC